MIPLVWFLLAWLVFMGLFALATMLTVMLTMRFGLSSFTTYATTALFLLVVVAVLLGTAGYLLKVDWSQSIDIFANVADTFKL